MPFKALFIGDFRNRADFRILLFDEFRCKGIQKSQNRSIVSSSVSVHDITRTNHRKEIGSVLKHRKSYWIILLNFENVTLKTSENI